MLMDNHFSVKVNVKKLSELTPLDFTRISKVIISTTLSEDESNELIRKIGKNFFKVEIYTAERNKFISLDSKINIKTFQRWDYKNLLKQFYMPINVTYRQDYYVSVPSECIMELEIAHSDIYVKNTIYFDKVFNKGQIISKSKHSSFLIKREDYNYFSQKYVDSIFIKYKKSAEREEAFFYLNFVKQNLGDFNISEECISKVNGAVESLISFISVTNYDLERVFSKLMKRDIFLINHSLMLAYVLGFVFSKVDSFKHSDYEQFIMAALFHDFKLNLIGNSKDESKSSTFHSHTKDIIPKLKKLNKINKIGEELIVYHHENEVGSGIFKKYLHELPKYNIVFNVAHSYVIQYINNKDKSKIIDNLSIEFTTPYAQRIVRILSEL
jgi:hypothetical protein